MERSPRKQNHRLMAKNNFFQLLIRSLVIIFDYQERQRRRSWRKRSPAVKGKFIFKALFKNLTECQSWSNLVRAAHKRAPRKIFFLSFFICNGKFIQNDAIEPTNHNGVVRWGKEQERSSFVTVSGAPFKFSADANEYRSIFFYLCEFYFYSTRRLIDTRLTWD